MTTFKVSYKYSDLFDKTKHYKKKMNPARIKFISIVILALCKV